MSSTALRAGAAAAIEQIQQGLDALFTAGIDPFDGRDAETWIGALEGVGRRVDAAKSELVGAIDRRRLHVEDGHSSAGAMDASMVQNPIDLSWDPVAHFGSLQGATMREILDHYIDAEFRADWEVASAKFGDDACRADLDRTDAQRRADALHRIFTDAAAADGSAVPPGFTHNIHWDAATYEEMLASMDQQRSPTWNPDGFMCRTEGGIDVHPTEAAASSLVGLVRRVVVNAAGVVVDLGRARRFTGSARTAATARFERCVWPGCSVPTNACEVDHLTEHSRGGATCPDNGAPLRGRHNRWKQKGFAIQREPDGTWRLTRSDGSHVA